jgi:hypothetical protein
MDFDDQVLRLFAEADPVPDPEALPGEAGRAIAAVVGRVAPATGRLAERQAPTATRRRGAAVVAVAAAIVIVVGALGFALSRPGGSQPPAADVSNPSVSGPTLLEIGIDAMAALRTGDVDALLALLAPTATFQGWTVADNPDGLRNVVDFNEAIGLTGPVDCRATGSVVECDWLISDAISGGGLESLAIVGMVVEDGHIAQVGWEDYVGDPRNVFIGDLVEWIRETRPVVWAEFEACTPAIDCRAGVIGWRMTATSGALLAENAPTFNATR